MLTTELYLQDAYQRSAEARILTSDARGIQLDQTPFYAHGGGQPGDRGWIDTAHGRIEIDNTIRERPSGEIIHVPAPGQDLSKLRTGEAARAEIDWALRHRHMRCHTCLHLLCSLIPFPVTGGSVRADSGRLDFDIPESILDKAELTEKLQALIDRNAPLSFRFLTADEVRAKPELVRTLQVAPPLDERPVRLVQIEGIDLQACGGSHLRATGEIKGAWVTRIEKKGKLNRRVEIALIND
jgi:misacylated tRNA(Ala) deacylase